MWFAKKKVEENNDRTIAYLEYQEKLSKLQKELNSYLVILNKAEQKFSDLSQRIDLIEARSDNTEKHIISIQQTLNHQIDKLFEDIAAMEKRINFKMINERNQTSYEMETSITGVIKILDKRLEQLDGKKGIVVDLLKKIAKLENTSVPV